MRGKPVPLMTVLAIVSRLGSWSNIKYFVDAFHVEVHVHVHVRVLRPSSSSSSLLLLPSANSRAPTRSSGSSLLPPLNLRSEDQEFDWTVATSFPNEMDCDNEFFVNGEMMGAVVLETDKDNLIQNDNAAAFCAIDYTDIANPFFSRMDSESTFVDFTDDGVVVPAGAVGQWKEQLANLLGEPLVEIVIATSVLLNSLFVALGTVDSFAMYLPEIRTGELIVSVLFGLDFGGRWFSSSKDPGRHILNAQFFLDVVVVILPLVAGVASASLMGAQGGGGGGGGTTFSTTTTAATSLLWWVPWGLTAPSGLFNLELLRVLRLRRVLRDLSTFERFAERVVGQRTAKNLVEEWQLQLARVLLSLFTLVSVSTGLIYTAENAYNPAINNYFDALYFGLTTLTTVGYGDISPVTIQGKLVVCSSILVGVAVVPAQAATLVEALLEREDVRRGGRKNRTSQQQMASRAVPENGSTHKKDANTIALDTTKSCSQCGAPFHWASAQYCYACGEELD